MDRAGNQPPRPSPHSRPPTELLDAVVELASGGAAAFKATARRFSLCGADAEDAYQRGLEILITKAPTTDLAELRPWLHTVIKHEALAVRRQRERLLSVPDAAGRRDSGPTVPGPEEGMAERERVQASAEALAQLKTSEVQCMLLKALGYSYDEIAARTGFTWTKVNRSLTKGRRRFFERFEQIESGRDCRRLAPLLSAACDGEASPSDERRVRLHVERCAGCRAALRSYRSAPSRLAEVLPPAVLLPVLQSAGGWWSRVLEPLAGSGERTGAIGAKLQQAGEMLSAQKGAAVVASTAALAGGAVAQDHARERPPAKHGSATAQTAPAVPDPPPVAEQTPEATSPAGAGGGPSETGPSPSSKPITAEAEFGIEGDAEPRAAEAAATDVPVEPDPAGFESGGGDGAGRGRAGGEFAP